MNDVETYAPNEILIYSNTSSQTDEYIAHRIGLIPFVRTDAPLSEMSLNVRGRTASTRDLTGDGFHAVHETPIVRLIDDQTLHIDIRFAKGTAMSHTKHSHIGPVAYSKSYDDTVLSFETINETCPLEYALLALNSLTQKIDDSIFVVQTQYDNDRKIV
jgi:DNA-directed RNA polymerase alpha subunit